MIRLPKSVVSFGAVALVAGALTLAVPRAVHAVAIALVQVSNTASSPAITQSAPSQAAQLVRLFAIVSPLNAAGDFFGALTGGQQSSGQYAVPNNQSLVITGVDVTPPGGCTSGTFGFKLFGLGTLPVWTATAPNTGHFEYPSGLVVPPGTVMSIEFASATNTAGSCGDLMTVFMYGYLTSN